MDPTIKTLEEAMTLFIKFIEERHANDAKKQADEFAGLLLCIPSGSWAFPHEFNMWRATTGATATTLLA
jgi:hypothetical protein